MESLRLVREVEGPGSGPTAYTSRLCEPWGHCGRTRGRKEEGAEVSDPGFQNPSVFRPAAFESGVNPGRAAGCAYQVKLGLRVSETSSEF